MLLIIQNGYINPCLPKYLDEEYTLIKSYETDLSKIDLDTYSIIIILGGYQSVTMIDHYPYLKSLVLLISKCLSIRKPLFGICLGAQLVAFALGCEIKSSNKLNIGYDINLYNYGPIFRSHIDYIVPTDKIKVGHYHENMAYLYFYEDFVICIQCHPDLSPDCVQKYSNDINSIKYSIDNEPSIDHHNKSLINTILAKLKKIE